MHFTNLPRFSPRTDSLYPTAVLKLGEVYKMVPCSLKPIPKQSLAERRCWSSLAGDPLLELLGELSGESLIESSIESEFLWTFSRDKMDIAVDRHLFVLRLSSLTQSFKSIMSWRNLSRFRFARFFSDSRVSLESERFRARPRGILELESVILLKF